jgi:hypothetical protein
VLRQQLLLPRPAVVQVAELRDRQPSAGAQQLQHAAHGRGLIVEQIDRGGAADHVEASRAEGELPADSLYALSDAAWWLELRPAEDGRSVLVRQPRGGEPEDVTPEPFNVRTLAHEYGGGAFCVRDGSVWFSNFADQRLYWQAPGDSAPTPITPEPASERGDRYADGRATPDGLLIICVRERHHEDREADNEIVAVSTDGSATPRAIVSGADFYAYPRISPDGRALCWISWNHPRMPWDGSELWVADLAGDGTLSNARLVDGGLDVSVFQPEWSPAGVLHWTGLSVGRYYAGPTLAYRDGSRVMLKLVGASPEPGKLPIHLYEAAGRSERGELSAVTYVQRLNALGSEPTQPCNAGRIGSGQKTEFSADFLFYTAPNGRRTAR